MICSAPEPSAKADLACGVAEHARFGEVYKFP